MISEWLFLTMKLFTPQSSYLKAILEVRVWRNFCEQRPK